MKRLCIIIPLLVLTSTIFSEEIYIEKKANISGQEVTYDWNAFEGPYRISEEEFYEKLGLKDLSNEIKAKNRKYSIIEWTSLGVFLIGGAMSIYPVTIDEDKYYENDIYLTIQLAGITSFFGGMFGVFWADGHKNTNKTPYSYAHDKLNGYKNN